VLCRDNSEVREIGRGSEGSRTELKHGGSGMRSQCAPPSLSNGTRYIYNEYKASHI